MRGLKALSSESGRPAMHLDDHRAGYKAEIFNALAFRTRKIEPPRKTSRCEQQPNIHPTCRGCKVIKPVHPAEGDNRLLRNLLPNQGLVSDAYVSREMAI